MARVLDELRARNVNDLDCRPAAFGHDRLAATVRDLCDRWQLGVEHLATDGAQLADDLAQTVATYEQADRAAARVLLDAGAALDGSAGSGRGVR